MRHLLNALFIAGIGLALVGSCLPGSTVPVQTSGEPIVCITFDDAHPTVWTVAFPCMRSVDTNFRATHFCPMIFMDTNTNGTGVTLAHLKAMEAAGWETAGHTWHHPDLSALTPDSVEEEITSCYNYLVKNGLHHASFAYPMGNYNAAIQAAVAKLFPNIRTAHDYLYTDGVNRQDLGYYAVKGNHTAADLIDRVERARAAGSPLVIIGFHAVLTDSAPAIAGTYYSRESIFRSFLQYLKQQQLPVMTIDSAMTVLGAN